MNDAANDPRVTGYEFDKFRVQSVGNWFCVYDNTAIWILPTGERSDTQPNESIVFPTRTAALIALLRYEDRVRPDGELRVVPNTDYWDDTDLWCVCDSNESLVEYLTSRGDRGCFGDGDLAAYPTPEAALLAKIEHEEREKNKQIHSLPSVPDELVIAEQPTQQGARRWRVVGPDRDDDYAVVCEEYCMCADGKIAKRVDEICGGSYLNKFTANAMAHYANEHGQEVPEWDVWTIARTHAGNGYGRSVFRDGVRVVTFWEHPTLSPAFHATAWMKEQQKNA